jgi:hypothetical protein
MVNLLLDVANVEWNFCMRKIDCIMYNKKRKGKWIEGGTDNHSFKDLFWLC